MEDLYLFTKRLKQIKNWSKATKKLVFAASFLLLIAFQSKAQTGAALDFDGADDLVVIPHHTSLDLTKFTIETWVKWTRNAAGVEFISSKGLERLEIHFLPNNGIRFIPTSSVYIDAPANTIPLNTWIHLACVYDPSVGLAKMYVNGVEVVTVNNGPNPISTPIVNNNSTLVLASRNDGVHYPFKGQLDEFRLWDKVLTQAEIQTAMSCNIPSSSTGLVVNYHFNQGIAAGDNSTILKVDDFSGNANNGDLSGFSLTGASSNFVASDAVVAASASTPTFTAVAPIEYNATLAALPTTSNNSIDGTWLPALNNKATTEYTFTPNPGQCATTTTLTIVVNPPAVLPVSLVTFSGKSTAQGNLLTWKTASESNNAGFDVESSIDGKSFEKITFIKGVGTTAQQQSYSFLDKSPRNGTIYYRLQQVDYSGLKTGSNVIAVDGLVNNESIVYPNPAISGFSITTTNKNQPIYITDSTGKKVYSANKIEDHIRISNLNRGVYFIHLNNQTFKLIKE